MKKKIPPKFEICPNCDKALESNWEYCPACGQSVYEIKGSLKYMLNEVSGNLYSFDSKLFRTIWQLFVKPGIVASEYVSGKMARYVPPVRLYIFISLIFFLILSFGNSSPSSDKSVTIEPKITYLGKDLSGKDGVEITNYNSHQLDSFIMSAGEKPTFFNRKILVKTAKVCQTGVDDFLEEMKANAILGMFLLMPLSAFILYLFYRKKRRFYFDHLIASVYLHTAIFILFIINQVISLLFNFDGFIWVLVIFYFYLIWSLRNFYNTKWKPLIWRSIPIVLTYFVFLTLFIIVITLTSFFTF